MGEKLNSLARDIIPIGDFDLSRFNIQSRDMKYQVDFQDDFTQKLYSLEEKLEFQLDLSFTAITFTGKDSLEYPLSSAWSSLTVNSYPDQEVSVKKSDEGGELKYLVFGEGKIRYLEFFDNDGQVKKAPRLECTFDINLPFSYALNLYKFSKSSEQTQVCLRYKEIESDGSDWDESRISRGITEQSIPVDVTYFRIDIG